MSPMSKVLVNTRSIGCQLNCGGIMGFCVKNEVIYLGVQEAMMMMLDLFGGMILLIYLFLKSRPPKVGTFEIRT